MWIYPRARRAASPPWRLPNTHEGDTMKNANWLAAAAAACALAAMPAAGESAKPEEKPPKEEPKHAEGGGQQNRMKTCNLEAAKKELKGEERRAFMSQCLKGH
jgi:hypothetical protein